MMSNKIPGHAARAGRNRGRVGVLIATALLVLPACQRAEVAQLRQRVAELERQLDAANSELAARDSLLEAMRHPDGDARDDANALREALQRQQAELEAVTMKLVKTKVERDQLKQELAALRRRRDTYAE